MDPDQKEKIKEKIIEIMKDKEPEALDCDAALWSDNERLGELNVSDLFSLLIPAIKALSKTDEHNTNESNMKECIGGECNKTELKNRRLENAECFLSECHKLRAWEELEEFRRLFKISLAGNLNSAHRDCLVGCDSLAADGILNSADSRSMNTADSHSMSSVDRNGLNKSGLNRSSSRHPAGPKLEISRDDRIYLHNVMAKLKTEFVDWEDKESLYRVLAYVYCKCLLLKLSINREMEIREFARKDCSEVNRGSHSGPEKTPFAVSLDKGACSDLHSQDRSASSNGFYCQDKSVCNDLYNQNRLLSGKNAIPRAKSLPARSGIRKEMFVRRSKPTMSLGDYADILLDKMRQKKLNDLDNDDLETDDNKEGTDKERPIEESDISEEREKKRSFEEAKGSAAKKTGNTRNIG